LYMHKKTNNMTWAIVCTALCVVAGGMLFFVEGVHTVHAQRSVEIVCPADAKRCPDGSFVGRVAPDCSFAPCSSTQTRPERPPEWETEKTFDISAFLLRADIASQDIAVPSIVEFAVPVQYATQVRQWEGVAVDASTGRAMPVHHIQRSADVSVESVSFAHTFADENAYNLVDGATGTYVSFDDVQEEGTGEVVIEITYEKAITTDSVLVQYERNAVAPRSITVVGIGTNGGKELLKTVRYSSDSERTADTISFPRRSVTGLEMTFLYEQPLRITEISATQKQQKDTAHYVRFLAQPNTSYVVYMHPDREWGRTPGESALNLRVDEGVVVLAQSDVMVARNHEYVSGDSDKDGVVDAQDNCPRTENIDQEDKNKNGIGDACEDFDRDGYIGAQDNCPDIPNRNQKDTDGDGIGDACDAREDRFTEAHPWIPFAGVGFAVVVLMVLGVLAVKDVRARGKEIEEKHNSDATSAV
jgi:hypothetical protein